METATATHCVADVRPVRWSVINFLKLQSATRLTPSPQLNADSDDGWQSRGYRVSQATRLPLPVFAADTAASTLASIIHHKRLMTDG